MVEFLAVCLVVTALLATGQMRRFLTVEVVLGSLIVLFFVAVGIGAYVSVMNAGNKHSNHDSRRKSSASRPMRGTNRRNLCGESSGYSPHPAADGEEPG